MSDETEPKKPVKRRAARPDDPIYSRGFVIGGIGKNRLPTNILPMSERRENQLMQEMASRGMLAQASDEPKKKD